MPVNYDPYSRSKLSSRLLPTSPYEIYLEQVRAISDNLRYTSQELDYYPPQFGGIKGQRIAVTNPAVLDVIDFESKGSE